MPGKILSFLMPVGMSGFIVPSTMAMGSAPAPTDEEIEAANARIRPVARVQLSPSAAAKMPPGKRGGEYIYKTFCDNCHGTGVAGAPVPGDNVTWAPRIEAGIAGLMHSVFNGKNAMPPRGATTDATDEELRRAVVFMANKSGANFKEERGPRLSGPPTSP